MPTFENHSDVNVQYVAVLELPLAGNPVADHVVNGSTDRLRITPVVERRRHRIVRGDEVMAEQIERGSRHARANVIGNHVKRRGRQSPGGTHPDEVLRRMDGDASRVGSAVHASGPRRLGIAHQIAKMRNPMPRRKAATVVRMIQSLYGVSAMTIGMHIPAHPCRAPTKPSRARRRGQARR